MAAPQEPDYQPTYQSQIIQPASDYYYGSSVVHVIGPTAPAATVYRLATDVPQASEFVPPPGVPPDNPENGQVTVDALVFSEKSIRRAFIRKVYGILMVQLAITVGLIALFVYQRDVQMYVMYHPEMAWIAIAATFSLMLVLACCDDFRRRWPLNIILLLLFTLCEGFVLGTVSSVYNAGEVLVALGICTAVCLGLTIFAMQTKVDFTVYSGMLFVSIIILLIFGLLAIFIPGKVTQMIYASLGALLFSMYLVFDTQLMLGGKHKYSISPEEYIFAALNLYLDIINLFLYILALIGGSRRD